MGLLSKIFGRKKSEEKGKKKKEKKREILPTPKHPTSSLKTRFLGFEIPSLELTPEREEEIIDYIGEKVHQYGMEAPALLFFIPLTVTGSILSPMVLLPIAPWLEAFGLRGYDLTAFFSKRENVERLVKKIEKDQEKASA